jgi:antirestriction protein ArdC
MTKAIDTMQEITNKVVSLMEEHGTDWSRPWRDSARAVGNPISAKKREYTGINFLNLGFITAMSGYKSPVFATFKQWKSLGATVNKGSKGTHVLFYTTLKIKDKVTGEEKSIPFPKTYVVFNADQVSGWDGSWLEDTDSELDGVQDWNDIETADNFISKLPAKIEYKPQNQAFYSPAQDIVVLPERHQFKNASGFYGTALHELIHWTGHSSRHDRFKSFGKFGDKDYAFEELVAELGSAMLSNKLKVDSEPRADHAKYLNSWIKCLKSDPKAITKAAALSQKACTYLTEAAA